jgi:hypothetical protein
LAELRAGASHGEYGWAANWLPRRVNFSAQDSVLAQGEKAL